MSSNNAKMPASTNATNSTENTKKTTETLKRELSSTSIVSNGTAKLSSLTPARDLTLGGRGGAAAGANKKVFLPNLNVVRNKNTNVKTSKDTTLTRGRGRGRGADRGGLGRGGARGGRGGSSSLIQTTGVFSEGAGAVNIRQASRSSGYSRDVDDSPSAMRKPTLFKTEKKLDLKAELARDKDILKFLDDGDEEDEAEHKTDLDKIPVQLNEGKWKYIKPEIKLESLTQPSLIDSNEDAVAIASQIQAMHVAEQTEQQNKPLPRYPQTLTELLNNSHSQIFLMQLPDTLPCVDEETDSPECSKPIAEESKLINPADKKKKPVKSNILKKMEEGQVGRLIRYKSGRTKLVLGETFFDLDMGMETGFLQDLMSISCNRDERSGNMINLGPIQAKITATPDWEHLLKQPLNENQPL